MRKSITKQKFYCLLGMIVFMLSAISDAQAQYDTTKWKFSNPRQFGFTILDVDFFDNNNVIAVGNDGGIARSTNAGVNWSYGPFTYINAAGLRTKATLNDVHYISANVAYAVGTGGCMAKTTDGGLTWNLVQTPLFVQSKAINTCWFINENTGYIGGQANTADNIPKVYFTNNGGATWDSLVSPSGGKTRVGYINNPNLAPVLVDINGLGKEIQRIEFSSPTNGYVVGGGNGSATGTGVSVPGANATTCLPTGANINSFGNNAALVWKFRNGVLIDYSLSKERLGYTGINTNTVTCTTQFNAAGVAPAVQTYRAMNIINDSMLLIMSFNNNTVVRINTGRTDSTTNIANNLKEPGRYEILNFPFPPTQGPNAGTPIPAVQVLLASNPYKLLRSANGKIFASSGSSVFAPENIMWTSIDTGRNWVKERNLPTGRNFSNFTNWTFDVAPNGKFLALGNLGVVSDSMPGGVWNSNYNIMPVGGTYTNADFVDCNNGILAGGGSITVTENGGRTWQDKGRPDFTASFVTIEGLAYPTLNKTYFAVSNGVVYVSTDKGTTLDPSFSNFNFRMLGAAAIGTDSVWVVGHSQFSVPAASRTSSIFRSFNGGTTWTTIGGFPLGTTAPTLSKIAFPSRTVGYLAGTRNAIYKTTDGGTTWTSINPFPADNQGPTGFPNAFISYTEIQALDENTVFAIGNMFTNTGIKRVYKTINGGTTWTDITSNLPAIFPVGNLIGLKMHDANNGYVTAGSTLFKTTDGGATWVMDIAPINVLFETMTFAPRSVPAGINMQNRKLFVAGLSTPIMEYGNPLDIVVNSTETITNASCTSPNGGSVTINATGGIAPYAYSINGGAFQTSNNFTGLAQGVRSIRIKDAFCDTITKSISIGFNDNLTLTASPADTSVCSGAPVQLRAIAPAGATYAWSPTAGLSATNISNPVAVVTNNSNYRVTATLNGCVRTANTNINIRPNPVVTAGSDKTIVDGADVELNGSASGNTVSIAWTPAATLTGANTFTPIAKPSTTTTYTMRVVNDQGCTSNDDAVVTVIPYCVKVMNAFTPNGDGINDRWLVTNGAACTNQIVVKVFNRYGNEVYSNENYQNNWDGTYKGKPVPDGTYYYVINYRLISGRVVPAKGDVTILR
jgi:gliding motility-associated-like protein